MRLLHYNGDGDFSFAEFFKSAIPKYAILSHTWEGEEVTFEDLQNGTGTKKASYEKIRFCAEQAMRDDLQYFWVDTCCIDKSNSVELTEAINSMFRWYRMSTKCYVYLSDVSRTAVNPDELAWESAFRKSRWFTRGWTLQELLAPTSVEFFCREFKRIGDKSSLEQQIHKITGIPKSALQGAYLSQFSDKERFSWIQPRQTKVEEDKAYSLLGIFDVQMPLRYGEGMANAFKRLEEEIDKFNKCIRDLRLSDPRDDKTRIEDTKGGLLEGSYHWVLETSDFQQWRNGPQTWLLWIKGNPGKGKTMLLCGIINELKKSMPKSTLLSYFFCQATDSRINNATAVLRGLIYLLVDEQPSLISHVRKKYEQAGKALFEDANAWITLSEIFANIIQDPKLNSTCLIVDALDECAVDLPKLLDLIVQTSSISPRIKWIVSSRNWPSIEKSLNKATQKASLHLELNEKSVSAAVNTYIQSKVDLLATQNEYDIDARGAVQSYLSANASGTFLWVALVCQELASISGWEVEEMLSAFPPGLDAVYMRMMEQISISRAAKRCYSILAVVSIVYRPITLDELPSFVDMPLRSSSNYKALAEIIGLCGSFLTLRERTISFVHQSARDFLIKEASNYIFPSGIDDINHAIFSRSLQVMSRTLKRDVYSLRTAGISIDQIKQPDPDPLAAARYSCQYWISHLLDCHASENKIRNLQDGGSVYSFLCRSFLYWLEALSLMKSLPDGIVMIKKLENVQADNNSNLHAFIHDANRFALYNRSVIEQAPLQLYCSALIFAPEKSIVRRQFEKCIPSWVQMKSKVQADWSAALQSLEGHSGGVKSVAFSPDGKQIVSGSEDKTVRLWDAATGAALLTLEGHTGVVAVVIYSPDGQQLASVSFDYTIRLWDAETGFLQHTLRGYSGRFETIEYSPNGQQLASASYDHNIWLWDAKTGALQQILEGHSNMVCALIYSSNGHYLASASWDNTVRLWDTEDGTLQRTLEGHTESVMAIAFSPDGKRLVSGSKDDTVRLWDAEKGALQQILHGHSSWVRAVIYSPNGKQLASASYDHTIRLWDAKTGALQRILEGHSEVVCALVFSPNRNYLASASWDSTVRLWDIDTGILQQIFKGHHDYVCAIKFSPEGKLLASASDDHTVRLWNTEINFLNQPLHGHSRRIQALAFSPNGCRLASGSKDTTVGLWDTEKGTLERILEGHTDWVTSVTFSPDGRRLASAPDGRLFPFNSDCYTIHIWDAKTGALQHKLVGHSGPVGAIAFSPDGLWLASAADKDTVRIWDSEKGALRKTLETHCKSIKAITFSPDGCWLASASRDEKVRIYNFRTGAIEQTLEGHSQWVDAVAFSPDGNRLASASRDGTVKIWHAKTGALKQTFRTGVSEETGYGSVMAMTFSPDEQRLITSLGSMELVNSNSGPHIAKWPSYSLPNVDRCWIIWNGCKVLWLPVEYRPECQIFHGDFVAMGHASGQVTIIKFGTEGVPGNLSATIDVPLFSSH